jgi:hypothetical protein
MKDIKPSASMKSATNTEERILYPEELKFSAAGAGLPKVEGVLLKYFFVPLFAAFTPWRFAARAFLSEGYRALVLAQNSKHEHLSKRILIPRLIAMEDNSRYWSVFMALRHLILVGEVIEDIVIKSSNGQHSTKILSIVAVKPEMNTSATVLGNYRDFLERFERRLATEVADHHSKITHIHPWLGPLTTHQWLCLGAVHQRLHRRQIEMILREIENMED